MDMRWITVPILSTPIAIVWGMYSVGGDIMYWSNFMLVIVTAILAIVTGTMVFYIKQQFTIQQFDYHKKVSHDSITSIKRIQNELSGDKDFVNLINKIANLNEDENNIGDLDERELCDFEYIIRQLLNHLEELAILEYENIVLIDHIRPFFGVILVNISNIYSINDIINNYEIRGKKVYVHLPKLIQDIKS